MNERNVAPGKRFWKPEYNAEPSTRLFCPVDTPTLAWLAQRANGKPLGQVAADVLRTLAEAETGG